MSSSISPSLPPLTLSFEPTNTSNSESPTSQSLITHLSLQPHPEGGYFAETDRDTLRIPNPFASDPRSKLVESRSASTTIFYYLTPKSPLGHFHRNKARTVHTLHRGRGRYVLIHADEVAAGADDGDEVEEGLKWTGKARVETFVVGQDVESGERLQWVVEGGKYKASFLLPDEDGGGSSDGLLISETVVPGFEFSDHDFMKRDRFEALVTPEQAKEMEWMVRKGESEVMV
ncbi:uncharacterized protein LTR77_007751 [Saxophila tyrrhenica]|uniref:DUF985 domain-containing protein n=1 Tax=Saxophila tyrrhenica TaxID=1690608 RepID=A0AAV9P6B0_9PEZI|nr:hypothetical protein LTR77_007751 [Saxophila tyrrhenica]